MAIALSTITMIKFGIAFTAYIFLSTALFLSSSFTINAWIVYGLTLLPLHAGVLLAGWIIVWRNRRKSVRIPYRIWIVVLLLNIATILASPGNCYGTKQGERCYSNLQILFGGVPKYGPSSLPHWGFVDNAFFGILFAYCVAVILGVIKTSAFDEREPIAGDRP